MLRSWKDYKMLNNNSLSRYSEKKVGIFAFIKKKKMIGSNLDN